MIHISFDAVDYQTDSLAEALTYELSRCAALYNLVLTSNSFKRQFQELLEKLHAKSGRVVLLIDEYDKPIIDYLETSALDTAKTNRGVLREFYSILKSADEQLRLVFITGISKFAKVSLFSHLNNLSLNKNYAALAGYTRTKIETYFEDYLKAAERDLTLSRDELVDKMKFWYNGFSWDGTTRVYNPFVTLSFFDNREFRNYWFSMGSPNFLIEQMKKHGQFAIENTPVNSVIFDKFDIENIELVSLLFQTGYLTIKARGPQHGSYVLDYPNQEVRESMYQFLLDDLVPTVRRIGSYRTDTGRTMLDMNAAFLNRDLNRVRHILESILTDLPSHTYQK